MFKLIRKLFSLALIVSLVWVGLRVSDKQTLKEDVLRLHVIADSDSAEDQQTKLQVKDAIVEFLTEKLEGVTDQQTARQVVTENLDRIEAVANYVLTQLGVERTASVSLGKEAYPVRHYDGFSLPAGVYESLQVTIGSGEGENWWCVVFPSFCFGAASDDFHAAAAGAGFSPALTNTLSLHEDYKIDFLFLECLGRIENFLYRNYN